MLNILFAFFYLTLIQPYKVDVVFISVVWMKETDLGGVFNNLKASKWWSWDLDLLSETKLLCTVFYLTYCVGYYRYIHLCNRFLASLHIGWEKMAGLPERWSGHICCSEGACNPLGCNPVCTHGALSVGNCGNTEEHDQISYVGRQGRHQVNFLEEKYYDLAGIGGEEGIPETEDMCRTVVLQMT